MYQPPIAPKRPYPITQHGQTRVDDYFWMRQREDPAVMDYLKAENDYLEQTMQHTKELQEGLYQEMKGRIKEDDSSVPEKEGDYYYYTRYTPGKQYPYYCRRQGSLQAPEEIILDQNALAEGKHFIRIGALAASPDGNRLAYSVDLDGSEICTLYFKDLATGELLPEQIPNTYWGFFGHGGVEWSNDGLFLYYQTLDAAERPYRIYRHHVGTPVEQDQLLYEEKDDTYFLWMLKSRSKAFILALSHSTITDEWRVLPDDGSEAEFKVFEPRNPGIEYWIEHQGNRFFIRTNEDAVNFKLMETPQDQTAKKNWREVLPHRSDIFLTGVDAFADFLVLYERREGLQQIRISAPDGVSDETYVRFPEPDYSIYQSRNPEYKTDWLRFHYSSLVTPGSVIHYHVHTGQWELMKQDEIPSGYDASQYESTRTFASSPDGTRVPLSIVYKKGLVKNGNNPTLLYGYGSYGFSAEVGFDSNLLSLLDRGFVYAIAHVRGGSEMGRQWYEDGRLLNKKNTFVDFIACTEQLIAEGYTRPVRLSIQGSSAGGLLVAAALTMRPDLFGVVLAQVPFVDVVSSMSDPTIPLTTLEYDQWGNPDEDKRYFDYMLSYSPYDNLRHGPYPHVLLTTGLNDPRVAYWEPAKFAARLRTVKTDDHLVLLKTDFDSGHGGPSGRYDSLKDTAFEYAFIMDRLGVLAQQPEQTRPSVFIREIQANRNLPSPQPGI